jgi:hypothetical protein
MVDGLLAVITEALSGGDGGIGAFFAETVARDYADSGYPLPRLVRALTEASGRFAYELVAALPAELRDEGAAWITAFFAGLIADIAAASG